jgi:hypothetical protein
LLCQKTKNPREVYSPDGFSHPAYFLLKWDEHCWVCSSEHLLNMGDLLGSIPSSGGRRWGWGKCCFSALSVWKPDFSSLSFPSQPILRNPYSWVIAGAVCSR